MEDITPSTLIFPLELQISYITRKQWSFIKIILDDFIGRPILDIETYREKIRNATEKYKLNYRHARYLRALLAHSNLVFEKVEIQIQFMFVNVRINGKYNSYSFP